MGLAGLARICHVGILDGLVGLGIAGLALAGIALIRRGLDLFLAFRVGAFGAVGVAFGVVLIAGIVVIALIAGFAVQLVGHLQGGQNFAHLKSEARLVLDGAIQARQVLAGALLDPVAPQIDDLAARSGGALPSGARAPSGRWRPPAAHRHAR